MKTSVLPEISGVSIQFLSVLSDITQTNLSVIHEKIIISRIISMFAAL